jgi:hypothetical protein
MHFLASIINTVCIDSLNFAQNDYFAGYINVQNFK